MYELNLSNCSFSSHVVLKGKQNIIHWPIFFKITSSDSISPMLELSHLVNHLLMIKLPVFWCPFPMSCHQVFSKGHSHFNGTSMVCGYKNHLTHFMRHQWYVVTEKHFKMFTTKKWKRKKDKKKRPIRSILENNKIN